jgi:hypothetical protein
MPLALRYVMYAGAGFGLMFLVAVAMGKFIAYGNRRIPQRYTVVWQDTDVMLQAFTGTIEPVGEHHVKITDERGWSEMVDRRDIREVYC